MSFLAASVDRVVLEAQQVHLPGFCAVAAIKLLDVSEHMASKVGNVCICQALTVRELLWIENGVAEQQARLGAPAACIACV